MITLNTVQLIGKITTEPRFRALKSGSHVAELGLGVGESFRKENGEWENRMHFVDIVLWNQQAEYARDHLKKGDGLFVLGSLQYENWEDKDGHKRSALRVKASRIQIVPQPLARDAKPASRESREAVCA